MKKNPLLAAVIMMTLLSCTKSNFLVPELTQDIIESKSVKTNNTGNPDIPDMIDDNLLKIGAKIYVDITSKNDVTAVFELPKPNTTEQVTWIYEWLYAPKSGGGVKKSYDKTLKFHAESNSYVLLSVQCKKANGVKSKEILSSAKIVINEKKKSPYLVVK